MKYYVAEDQGHSLIFVQGHLDAAHQHFQTSFPLKPLGQLKPNFMCSLPGLGEERFGSHDQDDHHAHIWLNLFRNLLQI